MCDAREASQTCGKLVQSSPKTVTTHLYANTDGYGTRPHALTFHIYTLLHFVLYLGSFTYLTVGFRCSSPACRAHDALTAAPSRRANVAHQGLRSSHKAGTG